MARTMHEWICKCGFTGYFRTKPPKPNAFLYKAIICPKCRRPMHEGTGENYKVYSVKELL